MTSHSILVVGVGSIGERHARCFGATGRADVSICELNPALRQQISERYHIERAFGDFEEALASKPRAIVICTPAHLHIAQAKKAAERGIHLLIEKPLSTTLDGVDELRETIERQKVACAVAYVMRAHPALSAMRDAIQSGRFGAPVQIVSTGGQNFPFFRPAYRDIYYKDRATGGGAVQDALTHTMNAASWLVGPLDRLVSDLDHQLLEGVTVEDTVHVIARHGAVMGSYSLNQHQAPNESTITIACERGTVRYEGHEMRWRWMTTPGDSWHEEPHPGLERDTLFVRQAEAFLDLLDGARAPLCTLEDAIHTLKVNLAILESARTHTWQTIAHA